MPVTFTEAALGAEGTQATFHFDGHTGDQVFLAVSTSFQQSWLPALGGNLLVGAPFLRERYDVGILPQGGTLGVSILAQEAERLQGIVHRMLDTAKREARASIFSDNDKKNQERNNYLLESSEEEASSCSA